MWITFKSCIFAFWNNSFSLSKWWLIVVNYIQILYLCILKQPYYERKIAEKGCELHSNLVSLHSETTLFRWCNVWFRLWITFKSCIFAFWNNLRLPHASLTTVVNYIQILYLCILKQRGGNLCYYVSGCELHSNLVSLHSETTRRKSLLLR